MELRWTNFIRRRVRERTVYLVVETAEPIWFPPGALAPVADLGNFFSQTNERINRVCQAAVDYISCRWALCAMAIGSKGPKTKDWQHMPLAQGATGNHGLGLIHAMSGTCAVDLDDLLAAKVWLGVRDIKLRALPAAEDAVKVALLFCPCFDKDAGCCQYRCH